MKDTPEQAIAAWNTRAGDAELAALRALREAATTIYDDLTHYGRDDLAAGDAGEGGRGGEVKRKPAVVYPPGAFVLEAMGEKG